MDTVTMTDISIRLVEIDTNVLGCVRAALEGQGADGTLTIGTISVADDDAYRVEFHAVDHDGVPVYTNRAFDAYTFGAYADALGHLLVGGTNWQKAQRR
jgi:hypothetical protein